VSSRKGEGGRALGRGGMGVLSLTERKGPGVWWKIRGLGGPGMVFGASRPAAWAGEVTKYGKKTYPPGI